MCHGNKILDMKREHLLMVLDDNESSDIENNNNQINGGGGLPKGSMSISG